MPPRNTWLVGGERLMNRCLMLKEDGAAPDVLSRLLSEKREKVAHNCLGKLGASLRDERILELGLKG